MRDESLTINMDFRSKSDPIFTNVLRAFDMLPRYRPPTRRERLAIALWTRFASWLSVLHDACEDRYGAIMDARMLPPESQPNVWTHHIGRVHRFDVAQEPP